MSGHFHHDITSAAWITFVALVGFNVIRFVAAQLAARNIGIGTPLGALVTFGG